MNLAGVFEGGYWPSDDRMVTSDVRGTVNYNPSPNNHTIPKIIHQSWKTSDLPPKFRKWHQSWIDVHEGWEIRLWTDQDNLQLVKDKFPFFLDRYNQLSSNIKRADAARFLYMYEFGGFYADLDVECLQHHETLRYVGSVLLPLMDNSQKTHLHNIPNAWLASPPKHMFWMFALNAIMNIRDDWHFGAEEVTGPVALMRAAKLYDMITSHEKSPPIKFMAPGLIFPYSWFDLGSWVPCATRAEGFDPIACQEKVDPERKAFSITYWSHTWEGDDKSVY